MMLGARCPWAVLIVSALALISCAKREEVVEERHPFPDARMHLPPAAKRRPTLPDGIKGYREVFFTTDRIPVGGGFGPDGAEGGQLRFGRVVISIPEVHQRGEIERPWSVYSVSLPEDAWQHIVITSRSTLQQEDFFGRVTDAIDAAPDKEAFVFVHGFNVPFDDALLRTGQLAWDMKFRGPAITYSWPSAGRTSKYGSDLDMADWTAPHLAAFLQELRQRTGKRVIHLVAHSMGSRVLGMALDRLALANPSPVDHFQEVVMAAPDINSRVLSQLESVFKTEAERVTIYASNRDRALWFSSLVRRSPARAGSNVAAIDTANGWDVIDATQARASLLGHSYFAEDTVLLNDLALLLKQRMSPDQRSITLDRAGPIWVFRP
jgi:esterase/lipase superfamily enzyme